MLNAWLRILCPCIALAYNYYSYDYIIMKINPFHVQEEADI